MKDLLLEDFQIYEKDIEFCKKHLCDSVFLITGSTGLIGSLLCKFLIHVCPDIRIVAPVRNIVKANQIFDKKHKNHIKFISVDLDNCDYSEFASECDYWIHCAAPTSSRFFVTNPVETFDSIIKPTSNILEYAKNNRNIKSIVYLSSLEVYGDVLDCDVIIDEVYQGYVKVDNPRSSYPIAKRAAENLCASYAAEYDVPVKIARLTQVSGIGIDYDDNRILAQFCRCKALGKSIVLNSTGKSSRPYCYTMDAILAILVILFKGRNGFPYNVANDETYISALDLARKISDIPPKSEFSITIDYTKGYANETYHHLSSDRLRRLGWHPRMDMNNIITRIISYLSDCNACNN